MDSFLLIVFANEMTIHDEKTIFSSPAEILDSTKHASMSSGLLLYSEDNISRSPEHGSQPQGECTSQLVV